MNQETVAHFNPNFYPESLTLLNVGRSPGFLMYNLPVILKLTVVFEVLYDHANGMTDYSCGYSFGIAPNSLLSVFSGLGRYAPKFTAKIRF